MRPLLIIISAPSGGGKTTLCRLLLKEFDRIVYSISCTTRPKRKGETDGKDYFFLTPSEFKRKLEQADLLEHAEVHGYAYGTPRARVEKILRAGRDVLLDIDVQGAMQVRSLTEREPHSLLAQAYLDIFIMPPDLATLRERLLARGQDSLEVIERRLANAALEIQKRCAYKHIIINDNLEQAYSELRDIILAERQLK